MLYYAVTVTSQGVITFCASAWLSTGCSGCLPQSKEMPLGIDTKKICQVENADY